jgi:hypothetical protein
MRATQVKAGTHRLMWTGAATIEKDTDTDASSGQMARQAGRGWVVGEAEAESWVMAAASSAKAPPKAKASHSTRQHCRVQV